jgi:hypothetical protein
MNNQEFALEKIRKIIKGQSGIFYRTATWSDKNYILLLEHYF